jgi:hypothetical protein
MNSDIDWIEQYINGLHSNNVEPIRPTDEKVKKEINVEKISLDMKILQQRIDSVSIIKYYKDLKNDRLKSDNNIVYVQNEEDLFKEMNMANDNKPWSKLDNYTKKKKILDFLEKLITKEVDLDKKEINVELFKMLDDKKITKKNIEFDEHNNIITLGKYTIIS